MGGFSTNRTNIDCLIETTPEPDQAQKDQFRRVCFCNPSYWVSREMLSFLRSSFSFFSANTTFANCVISAVERFTSASAGDALLIFKYSVIGDDSVPELIASQEKLKNFIDIE